MKYVTKDEGEFIYLYAKDVSFGKSKEPLITYIKKRKQFAMDAIFAIDADILQNFISACVAPKLCDNQAMSNAGNNQ